MARCRSCCLNAERCILLHLARTVERSRPSSLERNDREDHPCAAHGGSAADTGTAMFLPPGRWTLPIVTHLQLQARITRGCFMAAFINLQLVAAATCRTGSMLNLRGWPAARRLLILNQRSVDLADLGLSDRRRFARASKAAVCPLPGRDSTGTARKIGADQRRRKHVANLEEFGGGADGGT